MSEEGFVDPFSEDELKKLFVRELDGSFEALSQAVWQFAQGNDLMGDARTLGLWVSAEYEDTQGNRWIRHFAAGPDGTLPVWTVKGILHDALDEVDAMSTTRRRNVDE